MVFISFFQTFIYIPADNTIRYNTNHEEITLPIGTLPTIIIIPDTRSKVASKFLILNALYDADATKNANNENIVADIGENI